MLAHVGDFHFVVAEGGLDDEVGQAQVCQAPPECWVRAGVASEDPVRVAGAGPGVHGKADGGHRVHGGQHFDGTAAKVQAVANLEGVQRQHGCVLGGERREVRPDDAVEDVTAQGFEGLGQGMHLDGRAAGGGANAQHGVGQQRDAQHVVQVRVAEQDVVDGGQCVQRQVTHTRAGVDEDIVVEQEGGGLVAGGNGTGAAQDADVHAVRGLDWGPRIRRGRAKNVRSRPVGRTVGLPTWRDLYREEITRSRKVGGPSRNSRRSGFAGQSAGGAFQPWMNCICVPASSIRSPLRSAIDSPVSGMPLTLGRWLPSTWANT